MGFLDDDVEKTGNIHYGYEVLGTLDKLPELSEKMDISAVIAIQDGAIRKTIVPISTCSETNPPDITET